MRVSLGDINTVAQTIQKIEGYYPGSLSYRNNNPGNLVYAGQPGATPVQVCNPTCHTFASFGSYDAGYQALLNQIQLDAERGETIQQFIAKYAPAQDGNNPTSYAAQIANATGLSVDDPLTDALDGSSAPLPADTTGYTADSGSADYTSSDGTISIAGYDVPYSYVALGGVGVLTLLWFLMRG